jgi:PEP-CTERM motif
MKKNIVLLAVGILAAVAPRVTAQSLIVNGTFNAGITGWTTNGDSGSIIFSNKKGVLSPATNAAVFNALSASSTNGVLYQSFSTTAGASYTLTFYYGGYTAAANPKGKEFLGVVAFNGSGLGGSILLSNTVTPSVYANLKTIPADFTQFTDTFVATGSITTLEFLDRSSDTSAVAGVLDDVSVVAVPEPSTVALSAFGALCSLAAWRRRK